MKKDKYKQYLKVQEEFLTESARLKRQLLQALYKNSEI